MNDLLTKPIAVTAAAFLAFSGSFSMPTKIKEAVPDNGIDCYSHFPYFVWEERDLYSPIRLQPTLDIIKKIRSFQSMPTNWNGEQAVVPEWKVLSNSVKFIQSLPESVSENLDKENIVMTPYGTLVFDWEKEGKLVSVEIGDNQIGFFSELESDVESPALDAAPFNENNLPSELLSAFQVLYKEAYA